MHPWMALWIWSEAMSRAILSGAPVEGFDEASIAPTPIVIPSATAVRAADYLQTEVTTYPLPDDLLDRLADLYWTERESQLPI